MAEGKAFFKKLFAKLKKRDKAPVSSKQTKWTPSYIALTVIGILLCVVLIPIFIINITLTIKGAANPDEVPTVFGVTPLIVVSGSMEPVILTGDLVFIKKTDVDALAIDDIIAYKEIKNDQGDFEVVTHRIIRFETLESGEVVLKMKGDYNLGEDTGFVQKENVVGIYNGGRVAKVGNFMLKMQEPIGMALFIGVPVVLFIGLDVLRRYLYSRKHAGNEQGDTAAVLATKDQELEAVKAELERLKALQNTETAQKEEDLDSSPK